MARPDPRLVATLLLLLLAVAGLVLDRLQPSWLAEDPLLRPFGIETATTANATAPERDAQPKPPVAVPLRTATVEQLCALPGVGPVTAERMLAYRETTTSIEDHEQLLAIKGIGPKRLEALKPWILLSEAPDSSSGPVR